MILRGTLYFLYEAVACAPLAWTTTRAPIDTPPNPSPPPQRFKVLAKDRNGQVSTLFQMSARSASTTTQCTAGPSRNAMNTPFLALAKV